MNFAVYLLMLCYLLGIQCGRSNYSDDLFIGRLSKGGVKLNIFERVDNQIGDQEEYDAHEQNSVVEVLRTALNSCDQSFNEAEAKINMALNQIHYDGKSALAEVFLASLTPEASFNPSPFSWKLPSSMRVADEEMDEKYLDNLILLVTTVKEACLALPSTLPHKLLFESSQTEVVTSLVKWSRKWFQMVEMQMMHFMEKCQSSTKCSKFLTEIMNLSIYIVEKENLSDITEVLDRAFELLKSDSYFGPSLHGFDDLWSKLTGQEDKELDPYWLVDGFLTNRDHHQIHAQNPTSKYGHFGANKGDLEIDPHIIVQEVPKEYLSIAFGSKLIQENFRDLPEKRSRLLNLALGLSPTYIRMGGSAANFLTYDSDSGEEHFQKIKGWSYDGSWRKTTLHPKLTNDFDYQKHICEKQLKIDVSNFTMTGNQWKFLVDLVKELNTVLLFDLNQFIRDESGSWDPSNAKLIMEDEATKQIPVIWQLGNEPNSYKNAFGWYISPEEVASDFQTLRKELERISPSKIHFIVGPDVSRPKKITRSDSLEEDSIKFLSTFLKLAGNVVDAVSWHQYYLNGRTANMSDFTSIENMNLFVKQVNTIAQQRDKWAPGKPIWLTETANAFGGGSYRFSQTFAATFLWLDKLGAAALGGVSMVYRQTLYGGCYGLLDRKLMPTPNYWVSVLHKQLAGQIVLLPRVRLAPKGVRIYAHCMAKEHRLYQKGAVVVYGMNVGDVTSSLQLSNEAQYNSTIYEFRLSAPLGELRSGFTLLNGDVLEVNKSGKVPHLEGHEVKSGQLVLPPKTIMFYAIPKAQINFC